MREEKKRGKKEALRCTWDQQNVVLFAQSYLTATTNKWILLPACFVVGRYIHVFLPNTLGY